MCSESFLFGRLRYTKSVTAYSTTALQVRAYILNIKPLILEKKQSNYLSTLLSFLLSNGSYYYPQNDDSEGETDGQCNTDRPNNAIRNDAGRPWVTCYGWEPAIPSSVKGYNYSAPWQYQSQQQHCQVDILVVTL